MKLIAFEINGDALGVDIPTWLPSALEGSKPFKFSDTVEAGYRDITSVTNIHSFWTYTGRDYKYAKDVMKEHVISLATDEETGFNALAPQEMGIAAQWSVGAHAQHVSVLGLDNLVMAGQYYSLMTMKSREKRLSRAISEVYNRLFDNKETVLTDANNDGLITSFLNGREGTLQGDAEGLIDYINATASTAYELTGLRAKAWSPEGYTNMNDFCDYLIDILVNGNY